MAEFEPLRIGDDERNRAVELLSEHLADGRLTQAEFNERLSIALGARTNTDIEQLFSDLPGPNPGRPQDLASLEEYDRRETEEQLEQAKAQRQVQARVDPKWIAGLTVATGLAWAATIIIYFSLYPDWKIFIVPVALSIALAKIRTSIR